MQVVEAPGARVVGYRYRVRWENVAPVLAVLAFAIALLVLVTRDDGDMSAASSAAAPRAYGPPAPDSATLAQQEQAVRVRAELEKARGLMEAGRFGHALGVLEPLLEQRGAHPEVGQLYATVEQRVRTHDTLLTRLGSQIAARRYGKALDTIDRLADLKPLTPELRAMQRRARRGVTAESSHERARRLLAAGRLTAALQATKTARSLDDSTQLRGLQRSIEARIAARDREASARGASGIAALEHASGHRQPV